MQSGKTMFLKVEIYSHTHTYIYKEYTNTSRIRQWKERKDNWDFKD